MDPFHDHLDECRQCAEHPFDLCSTGDRLLQEEIGRGSLLGATLDMSGVQRWMRDPSAVLKIVEEGLRKIVRDPIDAERKVGHLYGHAFKVKEAEYDARRQT